MPLLFSFPENRKMAEALSKKLKVRPGKMTLRNFPDGECYVRIEETVENQDIVLVCGLNEPDRKAMGLLFFCKTAKELGAKKIHLVSPYLGYMRQDKRFNDGEAITSSLFAKFLSEQVDGVLTVDPHLHRHKHLSEVYLVPTKVVHAAPFISDWIKGNLTDPVLIGPDEESSQWVSEVASKARAPFTVLTKRRLGDRQVEVSVPRLNEHKDRVPVLVDDIISTARTMIEAIKQINQSGMKRPICIGVHAVFAENSYEDLQRAGANEIVTCNTIEHPSNRIDIADGIVQELARGMDT